MPYKNEEDKAKAKRKHYETNKEVVKARAKANSIKAKRRNREFLIEYLNQNPCVDCGFSDVRALQFDHVKGIKLNSVSNMAKNSVSIAKLQEEIEKCEVRCANCHSIKTSLDQQWAGY